jgi:glycosyltransferase involved in cell wall biosynthesis
VVDVKTSDRSRSLAIRHPDGSGPRGVLGMLMLMGGGLRDYVQNGQLDNLFRYHLPGYLRTFERISFFSYLDERIEDYTDDPELRARVTVWPRRAHVSHKVYAAMLPWVYRAQVRECTVFRVLQATGALPAALARAVFGVPYVTTFGYRYAEFAKIQGGRFKAPAVALLERLAVRCAAAVIVTTDAMRDHVMHLGRSSDVVLIPNGIDTSLFSPARPSAAPGRRGTERRALFVGRLEPQKNLPMLLEALAIVRRRHDVRLTLVGEGALRDALVEKARALQVPAIFAGVVPNETLPTYFQDADVFVLPSLAEGHPKALLEAMSCGLACVVSGCQGNRSVVTPGVTALVHEVSDVEGLASALTRVLEDDGLRAALGSSARADVIHRFDIEATLQATGALLREVAASRLVA